MVRIGIMTFLHNDNYGSTLQAWALQQILSREGYDAVHIDYKPSSKEKLLNLITSMNSPLLLMDGIKKRRVKSDEAGARKKVESFHAFYQENMRLSNPCFNKKMLLKQSNNFDVLICGSDQIWSPEWFNPAYYLDFVQVNKPLIAYAPSFGVSRIQNPIKAKRIQRLIDRFNAVSIRQLEGAALVQRLTKRTIPVMPDPVFLLARKEWETLAGKAWSKQPYIACYFIGNRPDYWQKVQELHDHTGFDVVIVPVTETAYHQPWALAEGLSPAKWLGLLNGAKHIITDSFHGAAFSMILGKNVTVLRRYKDGSASSKNSRIDQLYRQLAIDDPEHLNPALIEQNLEHLRLQGTEWLLHSISQAVQEANAAQQK